MQATAQLIGLANAMTYGWNETVAKQLVFMTLDVHYETRTYVDLLAFGVFHPYHIHIPNQLFEMMTLGLMTA